MTINIISQQKCFGGTQFIYSHTAKTTHCTMRLGVFLPPKAKMEPVPALYWLSGLTCTEENFVIKAGAQRMAALLGIAIITPDTSPRGLGIPGESEGFDFGFGAGFYLDATIEPWVQNYQMYSYITQELPELIRTHLPIDANRIGISGHSMGGHGALTIALKNPDYFKSVSAFAPICSLTQCPWGEKALQGYLGDNPVAWQDYDATALIKTRGWRGPEILIDQGTADSFLTEQLKPELFIAAAKTANVPVTYRFQEDYDHSYFFIATFIDNHLKFHASHL
ncbi:MAG: S-formylglutathione hydrolase [Gammaproteobacteria bacterium]|nr:S-formylglutathione hydrolase [Gammaproteobacteria bacterium]